MIIIKNQALIDAVKAHSTAQTRIAIQAGTSPSVMDKVLLGETDFTLTSANKLAEFLNFDVVVEFVNRPPVS